MSSAVDNLTKYIKASPKKARPSTGGSVIAHEDDLKENKKTKSKDLFYPVAQPAQIFSTASNM